jgi:hypothetical protein
MIELGSDINVEKFGTCTFASFMRNNLDLDNSDRRQKYLLLLRFAIAAGYRPELITPYHIRNCGRGTLK